MNVPNAFLYTLNYKTKRRETACYLTSLVHAFSLMHCLNRQINEKKNKKFAWFIMQRFCNSAYLKIV